MNTGQQTRVCNEGFGVNEAELMCRKAGFPEGGTYRDLEERYLKKGLITIETGHGLNSTKGTVVLTNQYTLKKGLWQRLGSTFC